MKQSECLDNKTKVVKPEVNFRFFLQLFWATFTLSIFTFGGGFVIISLMRKKMVATLHWIDDEQMMDFVTIAQSSPGPIAVNGSLMVGYHLAKLPGALVAALGTILPPMIILSLVSLGYEAVKDNLWIDAAFHGMRPVVAAIVLQVTWVLFKPLLAKKKIIPLLMFALSFVALYLFKVNIMLVMVICIIVAVIVSLVGMKKAGLR
ncbi:MAG: chromate transporter [Sphaerochaeta sp.]|nr:chromate transporter [Sphaerochaeta sp.]